MDPLDWWLLMSHQESSYDVQVYMFWFLHWVFLFSLTYFNSQDWYFQFYNLCNWLIVVSPLAKGELPHQNFTSMITWPPKAYCMSRKKVGPPAAESERNLRSFWWPFQFVRQIWIRILFLCYNYSLGLD